MAHQFTDDDRDKPVVTAEGQRIGHVRDVDGDRATVERDDDESLTDKVKNLLGWDDDESNELHSDHVESRSDDRIRLRDSR
jgi:hypothetical protein